MRYRLRTLLIAITFGPAVLEIVWSAAVGPISSARIIIAWLIAPLMFLQAFYFLNLAASAVALTARVIDTTDDWMARRNWR